MLQIRRTRKIMGNFLLEQIYFLVPILIVIYLMLLASNKVENRNKKENAKHIYQQNEFLIKEYIDETAETDEFLLSVDKTAITLAVNTELASQGYSTRIPIPPANNAPRGSDHQIKQEQLVTKSVIKKSINRCRKNFTDLSEEIKRQDIINLSAASAFAELALRDEVGETKTSEPKSEWLKVIMKHSDKKDSLGLIICLFEKMKETEYERFYLEDAKIRRLYRGIFVSLLKQGVSYNDCILKFDEYIELVTNYRSILNATADDFLPRKLWPRERIDPRKLMDELNRLRPRTPPASN
tara:strand:+ start:109 stop:996 length:888 start_codon:yes stop_codon:yes gene_type:complete